MVLMIPSTKNIFQRALAAILSTEVKIHGLFNYRNSLETRTAMMLRYVPLQRQCCSEMVKKWAES